MRHCVRRSSGLRAFRGTSFISKRAGSAVAQTTKTTASATVGRSRKKGLDIDNDADKHRKKSDARRKLTEAINKEYGSGTVMKLNDAPQDIPLWSTGILTLDFMLGGGIPKGRIIEMFGPEGSGKTTLAWHLISEIQKADNDVYYFDMENAFHHKYALKIGVNPNNLILVSPNSGDQAFDVMVTAIRSRVVGGICVDSVAAMTPSDELIASVEDARIATQARLMSRGIKLVNGVLASDKDPDSMCTVIFINQLRTKVNSLPFTNPEVRPGGRALPHNASQILDVRQGKRIEDSHGSHIGHKLRLKTIKNKVAPPYRTTELDLIYGEGICRTGSLVDGALMMNILQQTGSYYSFNNERIGHGRPKTVARLKKDSSLAQKIEELARAEYRRRCNEGTGLSESTFAEKASSDLPLNGMSDSPQPSADLEATPLMADIDDDDDAV